MGTLQLNPSPSVVVSYAPNPKKHRLKLILNRAPSVAVSYNPEPIRYRLKLQLKTPGVVFGSPDLAMLKRGRIFLVE
ncbi:MAG: hypothetical protein LBN93_10635 [Candidatus Symbiothrix sp.]|jgi:hypothetical protein|nr:hypothetical protein [Candidatus Symbiothrix sp.]